MTTQILFPESWITKLNEDELDELERKLSINDSENANIRSILAVNEKRDLIIQYWNSLSVKDRKNIGKSKDEIENGYEAKFHSPITYEHVGHLSFEELDEHWQGTFLSACANASVELLKECIAKKSLTV